jgi:hypothetical protein
MTDLQCPATVILAAPGTALPDWLAGVFTPGAEDLRRAVDELSDLYRGETIAVLAPAGAIAAALGGEVELPVTVAVDSSGWTRVPNPALPAGAPGGSRSPGR